MSADIWSWIVIGGHVLAIWLCLGFLVAITLGPILGRYEGEEENNE